MQSTHNETEIQAFLSAYPPQVQATVARLREVIEAMFPDSLQQLDLPARLIAYGSAQTYKDTLCVLMPLKAGVNLGFPRGALLPDPAGLLTGTGKRARHVRLAAPEDADNPALIDLLRASDNGLGGK